MLALLMAGGALAAPGDYEPNDSMPSAYGPLAGGQIYGSDLEGPSDRDFFFFYVTSAGTAELTLTLSNLGGGPVNSDIDVTVLDGSAGPVGAETYVREDETRTLTFSPRPQKYFVEVTPADGFGERYNLTVDGAGRAIGPYSQISARCAKATTGLDAEARRLRRAEAKFERARNRYLRSRYQGNEASRRANARRRKAKAEVTDIRSSRRSAERSLQPWCSIAA